MKKHEFPKKIWRKAADLGFIGIHFPEEYSGQGLGILENILVAEEFCSAYKQINHKKGVCYV